MRQTIYKHLRISPETHQLVHFRGKDYYLVDYSENYRIDDFVHFSEYDENGKCLHTFTERIEQIEVNKMRTKIMLIMNPWSSAEEAFFRLKEIQVLEEKEHQHTEKLTSFITKSA
ncbi:MAG: hypothetical protein LBD38_02355 [Streptococcaceae bacterium]|nr:hypothetical protein [Streptococcaceae bacterium]